MQIDLRLLRQAQALAEHGSFSRAAEALHIAQPSLSRGIKELETRVGLPLFDRRREGHQPTDFGRLFLEHAAGLLAGVGDLEREVARAKGLNAGEVTIGMGAYAAECLAPLFAAQFARDHPETRLSIRTEDPGELPRSLRARSIDLAICESGMLEGDEALEPLFTLPPQPGCVVVRAGHPLLKQQEPCMADVLAYPFAQVVMLPPRILKQVLAVSGGRNTHRFPAVECPNLGLALKIVAGSDAFTFASLHMIRMALDSGAIVPLLHDDWMWTEWRLVRLRRRVLTPVMSALAQGIRQAHEEVLKEEAALRRQWLNAP